MKPEFDLEKAIAELRSGKDLTGKDGVLTPLIKQLTEAALESELSHHLLKDDEINRRNGKTSKTVKSSAGSFELETPRDRAGSFEPQLIKKNQTHLTEEIDRKILGLYAHGMSYRDISAQVQELYGIEVSQATISQVTDSFIPKLKDWQQRPLDAAYPIVWLDAIHYKVKDNGRYVSKAVYSLLAIDMAGHKQLLGLYLSDSEGAKHWLSVLTDLQHRGVEDIFIACVDGLTGFPDAISTIYPQCEVQLCIVHQIRNAMKYVANKHQREFMGDLKPVYQAINKQVAEDALDALEQKWGEKYPIVIKAWRNKWENLSVYFQYPADIRRVIYTTNAVEAVHRQFRKLTKTKGAFPNENSLLKLLYAGIVNASKKWTSPFPLWKQTLSQFAIHFGERFEDRLDI